MKPGKFPQVVKRRIGRLALFDLRGDLIGPWAARIQQEIDAMVKSDTNSALVFNLRPVESMDSLGAKAVVESIVKKERSGMIRGNDQVMRMIKAYPIRKSMNVMNSEDDLVKLFGKEMAEDRIAGQNKRIFRRIKTAQPLLFSCQNQDGSTSQIRAVITDMSESGLFAEYIDLADVPKSKLIVNPYELSLLKLQIKTFDGEPIQAEGKVVRVKEDGEQVGIGIEFYGVGSEEKKRIKQLLAEIEK